MPFKNETQRTKKANLELAFEVGLSHAFEEAGLSKEAGLESRIGGLLGRTSKYWAPATAGAVIAGPEQRMEGAAAGLGLGILGKRIGLGTLRRGMFNPGELQKAMQAAKLKEVGGGYKKLTEIPAKSKAYESIGRALGDDAPAFWESVAKMRSQSPVAAWGGRIAGGMGGGYLANQLLSRNPSSPLFQTAPAVSDASTHYTGLVPDAEYY